MIQNVSISVAGGAPVEASFRDLASLVADHAAARPQARALVCEGRIVAWSELSARMNRVARALAAGGVGRGDMVAVLADTSIAYVETFLGILRAGACVVPLPSMATPETLAMMLGDCAAKAWLVSSRMRDLAQAALVAGPRPGMVSVGFDFAGEGFVAYEEWLRRAPATDHPGSIRPEDPFNLIYSSGTTGTPKGILHPHAMRAYQLQRMAPYGFAPDCVTLVSTPLYSNTTLVALLPTLASGGTAVLLPRFEARRFLELAETERVTHAMLVPVQYQRILTHPDFDRFDLSSFRMKLSTSAPLHASVKRAILDRWPGRMVEIYGLTEGGATCILDAAAFPDKLHTVGRPAPNCDVRLIGENGREVAPGETGEVVGRAPTMMSGYHRRAEATEAIGWRDAEGRLYFRTGDMGRFDDDGFLVLLDRKKDVIISGGFNIYAADLEAVLMRHDGVAEVAVIGIPSAQWGETPLALVVPRTGGGMAASELCAWANARLGKAQRLSAVEFRDHLPRSSIGKVLKRELRAGYWRDGTIGGGVPVGRG